MKQLLKKYLVTVITIYILMNIIPSFIIKGNLKNFLYICLILSFLTYLVKPIINLIMLPINIITLNLSAWIINIFIFLFWSLLMRDVTINAWDFNGINLGFINIDSIIFPAWQTIIILAIFYILLSKFLFWVIR
jgi:uncharacterized membrane protein YvlD (DUF360 family)